MTQRISEIGLAEFENAMKCSEKKNGFQRDGKITRISEKYQNIRQA